MRSARGSGSRGRCRARRLAASGNLAIGLAGEDFDLGRLDVAGDDEDRVFRGVEAAVIGERVVAVERLDLVAPADDRHAIGMMGEERGVERLVELRGGVRFGPHAPLLHHHLALGRHDLVGEVQAGHAVGLELHHHAEVLAGDTLEIGGEIIGGEGVFLAAQLRHQMRELALLVVLGALEHQMFEEMRDAALAARIVRRAVAVPDHMGDDGRAMVRDDHDVHAVLELEMIDARPGMRRRPSPRPDRRALLRRA